MIFGKHLWLALRQGAAIYRMGRQPSFHMSALSRSTSWITQSGLRRAAWVGCGVVRSA